MRKLKIFFLCTAVLCAACPFVSSGEYTDAPDGIYINGDTDTETDYESSDDMPARLVLVNYKNPKPEDYSFELVSVENGHKMDEAAAANLERMLKDARDNGLKPVIVSSYRTNSKQRTLFDKQVQKQISRGLSYNGAFNKARTIVAYPGTSEHEIGLAADIVDLSYQSLDRKQEETEVTKWLMENCKHYGFVLRYGSDKTKITEIQYEPWHYRYVGVKAAYEMSELGYCLEEYIKWIRDNEEMTVNDERTIHAHYGHNPEQCQSRSQKYKHRYY